MGTPTLSLAWRPSMILEVSPIRTRLTQGSSRILLSSRSTGKLSQQLPICIQLPPMPGVIVLELQALLHDRLCLRSLRPAMATLRSNRIPHTPRRGPTRRRRRLNNVGCCKHRHPCPEGDLSRSRDMRCVATRYHIVRFPKRHHLLVRELRLIDLLCRYPRYRHLLRGQ